MSQRLVYFIKPIGLSGPIKIGSSCFPEERLLSFSVWSPFRLELIGAVPGTYGDENFLHQCFADVHSHREWFRSTPSLIEAINKVLAAGSVNILRNLLAPKGSIRGAHRRTYTPEWKRWSSYVHSVRWAQTKLRRIGEDGAWHAPKDVDLIMDRWRLPRQPTPQEFARLNEYLENPAAHSVIPSWRIKVAA